MVFIEKEKVLFSQELIEKSAYSFEQNIYNCWTIESKNLIFTQFYTYSIGALPGHQMIGNLL